MTLQGNKHTTTIKISIELNEQLEKKKKKDPDFNRSEWFEEIAWTELLKNNSKQTT